MSSGAENQDKVESVGKKKRKSQLKEDLSFEKKRGRSMELRLK